MPQSEPIDIPFSGNRAPRLSIAQRLSTSLMSSFGSQERDGSWDVDDDLGLPPRRQRTSSTASDVSIDSMDFRLSRKDSLTEKVANMQVSMLWGGDSFRP